MTTTSAVKNAKKANLLDHSSIKRVLDESVTEIVTSRGYREDVRLSNIKIFLGLVIIGIALMAQFYWKEFPDNKNFLIGCIISSSLGLCYRFGVIARGGYVSTVAISSNNCQAIVYAYVTYLIVNGLLQLIIFTKEKNAILFTHPPEGSFTSTGLVVSSKLPRSSDFYTLTIASADTKSISASKPVDFTKSVTKWFTEDGVLVEGLFWKDVEGLVSDYAKEPKKK